MTARLMRVLGLASVLAWASTTWAVEPAREVHGSADAFAVQGIALAWGVLRAPKEIDTSVVLRIEPDVRSYAQVEVVGRDPFTQDQITLFPVTEVAGPFDVKIPRARFADHPRTEIRLWSRDRGPPAAPALIIYFAGVPDTTPEVARPDELARSLGARIERARDDGARKAP